MDTNTKNAKIIQAAIAILSNHRAGIDITKNFQPHGIFKQEGGVTVNGNDITIKRGGIGEIYCYNDFNQTDKELPKIVKKATEEIINLPDIETIYPFLVAETGARLEYIKNLINNFVKISRENLLVSLFK